MAQSTVQTLVSPGRYVQGRGALAQFGENLARVGKKPLIISDAFVRELVGDRVVASLEAAGLPVIWEEFRGIPHPGEIARFVEFIKQHDADVVVGVGGGSAIDVAKSSGHETGIRWVTVPTAASTDAPTSALGVIYTAEHNFLEYRIFPHNPDLVLVDVDVIAAAPPVFLAAGVGDALATWLEAKAVAASFSDTIAGDLATVTGTALAKLSWEIIWENALPAMDAVRDGLITPAVEKLTEANILLSGLGFESGGLAAAHAIHNGLTQVPQTHGLMHGFKVNIGSLTQLVLEGAPYQEIVDFIKFTTRVGLPTTLTEVGIDVDDIDTITKVAEGATAEGETIHCMPFEVTVPALVDALRSIEHLSRRIREEAGLPAPVLYTPTKH
ncbi:glycerol dehydrogenase [Brachybacterium paraconglomeratum]|uniref:glycerol dehydrogenase n=1 Tax=Brachybacterium paraconglomeratum TaxID=173362 RepID=UPI00026C70D0|nr:glycerol dehydrogenase [Brachybacterium paraconglomeratum]